MSHIIEHLPVVVIHAHSRCNCRCVMCDIWKTSEHREFSPGLLRAQLPALRKLGTKWVVFSGGEPLMHSRLFEMAHMLREHGMRVTILSTGLLFERYAPEIAAGLDDAIVSLDGPEPVHDQIRSIPGCFRAIERGIQAIRASNPRFAIAARCTVQPRNHDVLVATAEAARSLGLNSISFLAADAGPDVFGRLPGSPSPPLALSAAQIPRLAEQLEQLAHDPFLADSAAHLERILSHFRAALDLEPARSPRCNAPWVSAVIETDGRIRPCFFHPPQSSLLEAPLDAAINSGPSLEFRESLRISSNSTCRKCVCSLHLRPGHTRS